MWSIRPVYVLYMYTAYIYISTPLLRQSASCIHRKIHTKFCGLHVNACIHHVSTGQGIYILHCWLAGTISTGRVSLLWKAVRISGFLPHLDWLRQGPGRKANKIGIRRSTRVSWCQEISPVTCSPPCLTLTACYWSAMDIYTYPSLVIVGGHILVVYRVICGVYRYCTYPPGSSIWSLFPSGERGVTPECVLMGGYQDTHILVYIRYLRKFWPCGSPAGLGCRACTLSTLPMIVMREIGKINTLLQMKYETGT